MASANKAIILGNLGADPELRETSSGQSVCELRIATNEKWTDKSGERQERTEWHRVIVWGRQGENSAQYLSKGRQVYVEGRIQTREYNDRDGNRRWTTEIVAQTVQFLSGGQDASGGRSGDGGFQAASEKGAPSFGGGAPAAGGFSDEEIPF